MLWVSTCLELTVENAFDHGTCSCKHVSQSSDFNIQGLTFVRLEVHQSFQCKSVLSKIVTDELLTSLRTQPHDFDHVLIPFLEIGVSVSITNGISELNRLRSNDGKSFLRVKDLFFGIDLEVGVQSHYKVSERV